MTETLKVVGWIGGYPRTKENYPPQTIEPLHQKPLPSTLPEPKLQIKPTTPIVNGRAYQGHDLRGG